MIGKGMIGNIYIFTERLYLTEDWNQEPKVRRTQVGLGQKRRGGQRGKRIGGQRGKRVESPRGRN